MVGLICQPDKPAGRGLRTDVAAHETGARRRCGIPVFQPASLSTPEARQQLSATRPDLILVAAYGKFIPDTILTWRPSAR